MLTCKYTNIIIYMLYIANVFTGSGGHFIQSLCAQSIAQDLWADFNYGDLAHSHDYINKYRSENFLNYDSITPRHWSELEPKITDSNQGSWIIEASTEENYASIAQKFGSWRRIYILVHTDYLLWQASNHMIKNRLLTGDLRTLDKVQKFIDESLIADIQHRSYRNHMRLDSIYGAWTLTFKDIFLEPTITVNLLEDYLSAPIFITGLINYRKYLLANRELISNHMPWLVDHYDAVNGIDRAVKELEQLMLSRMS